MDTSEDAQLDVASDDEDAEWERTKERRRLKKRNISKMDTPFEKPILDLEQSVSVRSSEGVCCSCSKTSSCKTSRCECRAANGACDVSCSCEPTKCSNREQQVSENNDLASHGAMLLQTALSEKPSNMNADATGRRPLSDIGNNLVPIIYMLLLLG